MGYIKFDSKLAGTSIGIWKIEEEEWYFMSRVKLYENEWKRLSKIAHPQKRLEWLSSRLCLKELLAIENTHRVESLNSQNGKPYLTNNPNHISYTHSNYYSAAIASEECEVAIDIEYLKRKRNIETRFLFMNAEELAFYDANPTFTCFILFWSAKETIYKMHGEGLAFKDDIAINLKNFDLKENASLIATVQKDGLYKEYEVHYTVFSDFLLTYTCDCLHEQSKAGVFEQSHSVH